MSELLKKRIESIKQRVKIRDLIRDYGLLPNQYCGDEFQMRCPFHGRDNTPSAHVYPDGHFHCFACHRHLDVIGFVQERESIALFNNVLRHIEQRYNLPKIEIDELDSSSYLSSEAEDRKPKVTIEYEFNRTEKYIIAHKKALGLDKYAKLLFVLDEALKTERTDLMDKVRSKVMETVNGSGPSV